MAAVRNAFVSWATLMKFRFRMSLKCAVNMAITHSKNLHPRSLLKTLWTFLVWYQWYINQFYKQYSETKNPQLRLSSWHWRPEGREAEAGWKALFWSVLVYWSIKWGDYYFDEHGLFVVPQASLQLKSISDTTKCTTGMRRCRVTCEF